MRRPDLLRPATRIALWVAAGSIAASCASAANDASPRTDVATAPRATNPIHTEAPSLVVHEPDVRTGPGGAALPAPPSSGTVTVSGGDLPDDVVAAYRTQGGDLVDPAEWAARYGNAGLPELIGHGVRLVEATRRAERTGDRWERVDEAAWLAMTNTGRDALITELAAAAGLDGAAERTERVEQGGDCVTDTYPPDRHGAVWTVQGCSYARYPKLVTVGVSRTGPGAAPSTAIDPTIAPLTAVLDGDVRFSEVRLGAPGTDHATLHLSVQIDLPDTVDVTAAAATVLTGPLAGWQILRGDDSVLLSGPTGATWTIASGVAVLDWAGRW